MLFCVGYSKAFCFVCCGFQYYKCGGGFALVTLGCISAYAAFTLLITQWRLACRCSSLFVPFSVFSWWLEVLSGLVGLGDNFPCIATCVCAFLCCSHIYSKPSGLAMTEATVCVKGFFFFFSISKITVSLVLITLNNSSHEHVKEKKFKVTEGWWT